MRAGIRIFLSGGASGLDTETLKRIAEVAYEERARRDKTLHDTRLREVLGDELTEIALSRYEGVARSDRKYLTFKHRHTGRAKRHLVCGVEVVDKADAPVTACAYSICRTELRDSPSVVKEVLTEGVRDVYPTKLPDICWNCMR